MFYKLTKLYARLAIRIYCTRVIINKPQLLQSNGPVLLAANHPNSFLDGIILTTLFNHPVHSLARGDAFRNKWINRFLRSIQLLPVYRTSEGTENLAHNYTTFAACQATFKENGIVLIFSEGRCENEWHLRPLKKGTARLATAAWENGIPLTVIPVGINYSSFKRFGKEVHLYFGDPITSTCIDNEIAQGRQLIQFNNQLESQLKEFVYEIDSYDSDTVKRVFNIHQKHNFYLLLLPALMGFIFHVPLFFLCRWFTRNRFRHSGHFDSVLTTLLLILYPFYWLVIIMIGFLVAPAIALLLFVLLPITAWACVQVKFQAGV